MKEKQTERSPYAIREYFHLIDSFSVALAEIPLPIFLGILVFLISILLVFDALNLKGGLYTLIGMIIFLLIVFLSLSYLKGKSRKKHLPSDKDIDNWLHQDIKKISEIAKEKLDIEQEKSITKPIIIYKPILWEVPNISPSDILYAKGKDGLLRFSAWDVIIIFLLENYLAAYHANLNFITGEIVNETTEEFFYKDIVKVGTSYKEIPALVKKQNSEKESLLDVLDLKLTQLGLPKEVVNFEIKISSGDSISVSDITKAIGLKTIPTPSLDEAIKNIRSVLREKK